MKPNTSITLYTLVIAGIALLLAVIPPIMIDGKISKLEKERLEFKKKYSIKIKGIEFDFSNGEKTDKYNSNSLKIGQLLVKLENFKISSLVTGFVALFLGVYLLIAKQNKKICIGSIGVACIAMAWQYISAGITIGVAVFI